MKTPNTPDEIGPDLKADYKLTPLTQDEADLRQSLEIIVDAGIDTFEKVGLALAEICDKKLYKSTHRTFKDYCDAKWGFKRNYAYRLIEAAKIKSEMLPMGNIPNERVARALARVPAEKRESVFEGALSAAESKGRVVTSLDIEQAAQPPPVVGKPPAQIPPARQRHKTPSAKTAAPKVKTKDKKQSAPRAVETVAASVTTQLKKLWEEATPTEQENFLKWVREQEEKPQFKCESCEATFETNTDVVTIYECDKCGDHYTTEDTSSGTHRCDNCNKFGSVFTRFGCPECRDGKVVKIEN